MSIHNASRSRAWLLWLAMPLAVAALLVALAGHPPTSQALSPLAAEVAKTVDPPSILPGQTPAPLYTVTFSNPATTTLIIDWITDTLPAGFLFVGMHPSSDWLQSPIDAVGPDIVWQGPITVPATSTLSLVYAVYVPAAVPRSPIPYANTVVARAGETTIGPATASLLVGAAELGVTKTPSAIRLLPGQTVDYTVTFANSGEMADTLTIISDTLDPSLTFVQMLPGSEVTDPPVQVGDTLVWTGPFTLPISTDLVLYYRVDTPTAAGWRWPCNEAVALAGGELVGPVRTCVEVGPAKASVYLPLVFKNVRWAQFTIAKSVTPAIVTDLPGEVVTYTVTIANVGNTPGKLSAVVDTLPAGFAYLDMVGGDVSADPIGTTGLIRWTGPFDVAGGGQLRLIYKVAPSQTIGQYSNSANVEALVGKPPAGPASALVTVEQGLLLKEYFDDGIDRWTAFLNYPPRLEEGQWYWGATDGVDGSGALTQNCCTGTKVAHDALMMYLEDGAEEWTDYRVEAKFLLRGGVDDFGNPIADGGYPLGLWIRGQWEPSDTRAKWVSGYYAVVGGKLGGAKHFVRLTQIQVEGDCTTACDNPDNLFNFNNTFLLEETAEIPGELTRNEWHTLVVEVRGNNIKIWFDRNWASEPPDVEYTDDTIPFLTGTIGAKAYKDWTASWDEIIVTPLQ